MFIILCKFELKVRFSFFRRYFFIDEFYNACERFSIPVPIHVKIAEYGSYAIFDAHIASAFILAEYERGSAAVEREVGKRIKDDSFFLVDFVFSLWQNQLGCPDLFAMGYCVVYYCCAVFSLLV